MTFLMNHVKRTVCIFFVFFCALCPICMRCTAAGHSRVVVLPSLRKNLFKLTALGTAISILSPVYADEYSLGARGFVQQGMNLFRSGDVSGSLHSFDSAISVNPEMAKFSWQRGISLYYLREYRACNAQFVKDVEMNPADSEEILWAFMCDSKEIGSRKARENMMVLPRADPRPIMRDAYEAFRGGDENDIVSLLRVGDSYGKKSAEYFYSRLYASLYFDAYGDLERSKVLMQEAVDSYYGNNSRDYMTAVARVHLQDGPIFSPNETF
jgi:tetratricopeptide (TPR) repeat protein